MDYQERIPSPVDGAWRCVAAVLAAMVAWGFGATIVAPALPSCGSSSFDVTTVAFLVVGPWVGYAFAYAAITGREPVAVRDLLRRIDPFGPTATPAQLGRMRELGIEASRRVRPEEAARLIVSAESRLPATPWQQLALLRLGAPRGTFTRAAADRFLARQWAEYQREETEAWREGWHEQGTEILFAEALSPEERRAFDDAQAALAAAGIAYPLPGSIPAFEIPGETARMQLAMEMPDWLDQAQRDLCASGTIRRLLAHNEVLELLPGVLAAWRSDPDLDLDLGKILVGLIAKSRPALLREPWEARRLAGELDEVLDYLRANT